MKNDRQYESSAFGAFIGMVGILITCLLIVLASIIPGYENPNKKGLEDNDQTIINNSINYIDQDSSTNTDTLWK